MMVGSVVVVQVQCSLQFISTEVPLVSTVSGSFGRIDVTTFHGDGSNLSNLPFQQD